MNTAAPALYNDFTGLTALKTRARDNQQAAIGEVARQFESMYIQMMLKSMRKASLAEGMFDGQAMQKYREMYDQQLAIDMANAGGIGLAATIQRQLGGHAAPGQLPGQSPEQSIVSRNISDYLSKPLPKAQPQLTKAETAISQTQKVSDAPKLDGTPQTFIEKLKPYAQKAASMLGLQPQALLAQAALETGWGKSQMKRADGEPSYNLFGIKADRRWDGLQTRVDTLEFRDGVPRREKASFRAYDSYEQSFQDYVSFVHENSRYRKAVARTEDPVAYFSELQQAGYATDPRYAEKILQILQREDIQSAFRTDPAAMSEEG